jgi:predicted nucleotidyltransferase
MKQNEFKAYASTFVAYLINKLGEDLEKIEQIILYGSIAKGEANTESDVDIFVNTADNLNKKIEEVVEEFYHSREFLLFKLKNIEPKLSVKVGELKKWESLQQSIINTGIILWGKSEVGLKVTKTKPKLLFFWENIGTNRGAFLNKLYGYKLKGKKYYGLISMVKGEKLGKSSILIPSQYKEKIWPLFKKYKVKVKQIKVFVEED